MYLELDHLSKQFDGKYAVHDLSLGLEEGGLLCILGSSGCGKTTTLNMIGGFLRPDSGCVRLDGQDITALPPERRPVSTVFQSYGLFPHMSVLQNVTYGLKFRNYSRAEAKEKGRRYLELVGLAEREDARISELSGGQQQRVALARAIVIHPQVLLMDEPLSNLDAKLRIEMRSVIHDIQRQVGITTVYVTHDQEEALAISDRIAVMNKGVIQQIGTPHHIYSRPANVFVATFIGHSNLFHATLSKKDGRTELCFPSGYRLPMTTLSDECTDGQEVVVGIRPEEFSVSSEGLTCDVLNRTFLGRYSNYFLHFADGMCVPDQPSIEFSQDLGHTQTLYQPGDHLTLRPNPDKINVFTADMEKSLLKDVIRYEQA